MEEEEVYDWLITHIDGRIEGAYTNQALQGESQPDTWSAEEEE
jgi:hypothetical protein